MWHVRQVAPPGPTGSDRKEQRKPKPNEASGLESAIFQPSLGYCVFGMKGMPKAVGPVSFGGMLHAALRYLCVVVLVGPSMWCMPFFGAVAVGTKC